MNAKKIRTLFAYALSIGLFSFNSLSSHTCQENTMQQTQNNARVTPINIFGNWHIKVIEVNGAFLRIPAESSETQLQIANNQISGTVGCNRFMVGYTSENAQQITINEGATTKKTCTPSSIMEFEDKFLQIFNGTFFIENNFYGGITFTKDNVKVYLER